MKYNNAYSNLDNRTPSSFNVLKNRTQNLNQLQYQRNREVVNENSILLTKMYALVKRRNNYHKQNKSSNNYNKFNYCQFIFPAGQTTPIKQFGLFSQPQSPNNSSIIHSRQTTPKEMQRSLNIQQRKNEAEQINQRNIQFIKQLQNVKPTINNKELKQHEQRIKKLQEHLKHGKLWNHINDVRNQKSSKSPKRSPTPNEQPNSKLHEQKMHLRARRQNKSTDLSKSGLLIQSYIYNEGKSQLNINQKPNKPSYSTQNSPHQKQIYTSQRVNPFNNTDISTKCKNIISKYKRNVIKNQQKQNNLTNKSCQNSFHDQRSDDNSNLEGSCQFPARDEQSNNQPIVQINQAPVCQMNFLVNSPINSNDAPSKTNQANGSNSSKRQQQKNPKKFVTKRNKKTSNSDLTENFARNQNQQISKLSEQQDNTRKESKNKKQKSSKFQNPYIQSFLTKLQNIAIKSRTNKIKKQIQQSKAQFDQGSKKTKNIQTSNKQDKQVDTNDCVPIQDKLSSPFLKLFVDKLKQVAQRTNKSKQESKLEQNLQNPAVAKFLEKILIIATTKKMTMNVLKVQQAFKARNQLRVLKKNKQEKANKDQQSVKNYISKLQKAVQVTLKRRQEKREQQRQLDVISKGYVDQLFQNAEKQIHHMNQSNKEETKVNDYVVMKTKKNGLWKNPTNFAPMSMLMINDSDSGGINTDESY